MILIIDIGYQQIYQLVDTVEQFDDSKVIPLFDFKDELLESLAPDGVFISHGSIILNDSNKEKYSSPLTSLKNSTIPILGIGSGHQLIGVLYGAEITPHTLTTDVITTGIINLEEPLFNKLPDELNLAEDRASTIGVPPNFQLLASSDSCINEAMKHREKETYGVQFIPERSGNHGAVIIENFVEISHSRST